MKTKIEKVTIIETDDAGVTTAVVHHDSNKMRGKKASGWLAIPESMALQGLDAGAKTIKSLRAAHRRSNMKRRDGWLMDLGSNMVKAAYQGKKRIKIQRLFIAK
jgi:hypothetical protein